MRQHIFTNALILISTPSQAHKQQRVSCFIPTSAILSDHFTQSQYNSDHTICDAFYKYYYLTYLSSWPRPIVTNTIRTRLASQHIRYLFRMFSNRASICIQNHTLAICIVIGFFYVTMFFVVVKYTVYIQPTNVLCVCVCAKTNHGTDIGQRQRVECNKSRGVPNLRRRIIVQCSLGRRRDHHDLNDGCSCNSAQQNDGHNNERSEIIRDLAQWAQWSPGDRSCPHDRTARCT